MLLICFFILSLILGKKSISWKVDIWYFLILLLSETMFYEWEAVLRFYPEVYRRAVRARPPGWYVALSNDRRAQNRWYPYRFEPRVVPPDSGALLDICLSCGSAIFYCPSANWNPLDNGKGVWTKRWHSSIKSKLYVHVQWDYKISSIFGADAATALGG